MTRATQPEGVVFGRHLRELRLKRKMTQTDLAEGAGLTVAYISNMENGFAVPSVTTVLRLAVAMGCKVTRLMVAFDDIDLLKILPR
jgi:transcriptional regulator with XRE-family HTH domain